MKRIVIVLLGLLMAFTQFAVAEEFEIVTVVKITGIPWFNRMEEGITKAGKDLGVKSTQVGPADADPAQQVKMVEDLVAKGVDAICVVPNDAKALEPVFKKAKEKGIIVLTHESPDQQGADWDIETIDNKKFGEDHFEKLAELIPAGRLQTVREKLFTLWDTKAMWILVALLLTAEWCIRKRVNMT